MLFICQIHFDLIFFVFHFMWEMSLTKGEKALEEKREEEMKEKAKAADKVFLDCEQNSMDANSEDLEGLSGMSLASLEDI